MFRHKRLEEIVAVERSKELRLKNIILFLPLVLSVGWMIQIKLTQRFVPPGAGELFSPIQTQPLIISLILFVVGYVFFLLLMFSDDIKSFFATKHKRHH